MLTIGKLSLLDFSFLFVLLSHGVLGQWQQAAATLGLWILSSIVYYLFFR